MKEIKITVDEDLHELLDIIAKKKNTNINELVHDMIKNEASKTSWKIIFTELEEAYEREKERRKAKK
jgi:metal-responsive CopG/Arc/MetJ family transcriptional regulator